MVLEALTLHTHFFKLLIRLRIASMNHVQYSDSIVSLGRTRYCLYYSRCLGARVTHNATRLLIVQSVVQVCCADPSIVILVVTSVALAARVSRDEG